MLNMMELVVITLLKKKFQIFSKMLGSKKKNVKHIIDIWKTEKLDLKCTESGSKVDSKNPVPIFLTTTDLSSLKSRYMKL